MTPDNRQPKKYLAYLFDLDGTLIDTVDLIVECFQENTKRVLGHMTPRDEIVAHIGLPLRKQYEIHLSTSLEEKYYSDLERFHMDWQLRHWKDRVRPMPNAKKTLEAIKDKKYGLAVVTSRRRKSAQLYLEAFEMFDLLDVLCTPENTGRHKPDPEPVKWTLDRLQIAPHHALMIGDSAFDISSGQSAGCDTCYVDWGAGGKRKVEPHPTYRIGCLEKLLDL